MNNIKKVIMVIILLILIFHFMIKHHGYTMTNYINKFLSKMTNDPSVLNPNDFVWSKNFRDNYQEILKEYLNYTSKYLVPSHNQINSHVASCDPTGKWKTLYLRAFNRDTDLMQQFPLTRKLINACKECTLAYFSVLEPGAVLKPHYGIYKGVIRYHLGLIIPDDWENCFIIVDNHKLHWRTGQDIMFDDLFLHHVENNTNQPRVILFLDIQRDFKNPIINMINKLLLYSIKSNDALDDTINNANKLNLIALT